MIAVIVVFIKDKRMSRITLVEGGCNCGRENGVLRLAITYCIQKLLLCGGHINRMMWSVVWQH